MLLSRSTPTLHINNAVAHHVSDRNVFLLMQIEQLNQKYERLRDDLTNSRNGDKQMLEASQDDLESTLVKLKSQTLTLESQLKHSHQVLKLSTSESLIKW